MDTTLSKNAYGEAITKATTIADAQPAYDIVVGRMEKNLSGDKGWKVGNNLSFVEKYAKHITSLGGRVPTELIAKAKAYVEARKAVAKPSVTAEFSYLPPVVAKSNISREEKAKLNAFYKAQK